jgi:hypothetical protein
MRTEAPKFAGPTRDILVGDDIREFVHRIAAPQLLAQWRNHQEAKEQERAAMIKKYNLSISKREAHRSPPPGGTIK